MKKLKDIRTSHTRDSLQNISIGEYTYGNPNIVCYHPNDKLTIGKFCSIAVDVTILIGMAHPIDLASSYPFSTFLDLNPPQEEIIPEETIIGNDVWIGYGALILSGVKIGDGAIIGARAVVSKDVEPYSIVAGSPLKLLRYRFPEDIRDALVEKKWWDLSDEKIEALVPYILQPDIPLLLEKIDDIKNSLEYDKTLQEHSESQILNQLKEKEIKQVQNQLKEKEDIEVLKQLNEKEDRIKELENTLNNKNKILEKMFNSNSWKMTKPVRNLRAIFKSRK